MSLRKTKGNPGETGITIPIWSADQIDETPVQEISEAIQDLCALNFIPPDLPKKYRRLLTYNGSLSSLSVDALTHIYELLRDYYLTLNPVADDDEDKDADFEQGTKSKKIENKFNLLGSTGSNIVINDDVEQIGNKAAPSHRNPLRYTQEIPILHQVFSELTARQGRDS